jgi:hypothetical protein
MGSDHGRDDRPCISATPAAFDRYLAAVPAMSLVPLAPFARLRLGKRASSKALKAKEKVELRK